LKYVKETLSIKALILCIPKYCRHIFKQHMTTYNSFSWICHHTCALHNFLFSKTIKCPFCMSTPLMAKSFAFVCTSNGFVKFKNFNTGVKKIFFFKSSNVFYCSSFHLKDNSFLRRSKSDFVNCKK
jgi:hypothetical protein